MNVTIIKLKDIFTIDNLKVFFQSHNSYLKNIFSEKHYRHIKQTIMNFLECRDYKKNYAIFECSICGKRAIRPHTCKSRMCPTCGRIYSKDIANNFIAKMVDKNHRHILFTMPDYLWPFFIGNTNLLASISDELFLLFKQYFNKKGIDVFGFSVFIHTFGRDIKFNAHLHIIITEGGFKKDLTWKHLTDIHYKFFKNKFKFILYKTLRTNLTFSDNLKKAFDRLWHKDTHVFFNVKGETLTDPNKAVKYLGRYLARPPIAEYRIISQTKHTVTFWYIDLKNKKKKFLTLTKIEFIKRIILQIPAKNFKMIRHYCLYSRNISKKIKRQRKILALKFKLIAKKLSWQQKIFEWIGFNPLFCSECKIEMKIISIIYKKKVYNLRT